MVVRAQPFGRSESFLTSGTVFRGHRRQTVGDVRPLFNTKGSGEWGLGNGEWEWGKSSSYLIPHSPFPIPHFPTSYSLFPTPHSPLPTPHSPFPIPLTAIHSRRHS